MEASEEDVTALFRKMGISKPPEEGDGFEIVKKKHAADPHNRFGSADDITAGPLQTMMNNRDFRKRLGDWLAGPRLPYAAFDRELTIEIDHTWNARELTKELKQIARDRASLDDDGFYVTIAYVYVSESEDVADVHWVGIEFKRGAASERAVVYDPGWGGGGRPTWPGEEPIAFGILLPLMSDPQVAVDLEWTDAPIDPWGDFGSREVAIETAEQISLGERVADEVLVVRLHAALAKLGGRLFSPKKSPCQVDTTDYFCQSWVLYLFERRSGLGRSREQMERDLDALRGNECRIKWLVLDFVRRVVRSDVAREYWSARSVKRGKTVATEGEDFYRWILWAVSLPEFGDKFACARSFVDERRRGRREGIELL